MDLKKLTKEALAKKGYRGIATVSFTRRGIVILSSQTVRKLGVGHSMGIDIFQGDVPSEFFISRGSTYRLRKNGQSGAVFNSRDLCQLVLEKTWTVFPHNYGQDTPVKFTFIVCEKPVDDEENSEIYALLRKKT